jgi:hypothetical protein
VRAASSLSTVYPVDEGTAAILHSRVMSSLVLALQVSGVRSALQFYVDPAVVEDLPPGTSVLEWIQQCEKAGATSDQLLSSAVGSFVAGDQQSLVLLGDAGAGKSTFAFQFGHSLLGSKAKDFLRTPVSRLGLACLPWIPVYIELRRFKASQLASLLPRVLTDHPYSLSMEAIRALRDQDPGPHSVRLLLVCDGYDEVHPDEPVRDLVSHLWGGKGNQWPSHVLKVVVTSRPNRFSGRPEEDSVLGADQRLLLLPFTTARVST